MMHQKNLERDIYVDKEMDKLSERLDRQRRDLAGNYQRIKLLQDRVDGLEDENVRQQVLIESMSERLCRCADSPVRGEGSEEDPIVLEYEGSPAPQNFQPLPVPDPGPSTPVVSSSASTTPPRLSSDEESMRNFVAEQENIVPACCRVPLQEITDDVVDRAEDASGLPPHLLVRPTHPWQFHPYAKSIGNTPI